MGSRLLIEASAVVLNLHLLDEVSEDTVAVLTSQTELLLLDLCSDSSGIVRRSSDGLEDHNFGVACSEGLRELTHGGRHSYAVEGSRLATTDEVVDVDKGIDLRLELCSVSIKRSEVLAFEVLSESLGLLLAGEVSYDLFPDSGERSYASRRVLDDCGDDEVVRTAGVELLAYFTFLSTDSPADDLTRAGDLPESKQPSASSQGCCELR